MVSQRTQNIGYCLLVIGIIVIAGLVFFNVAPPPPGAKGPIYFYGEALATDDTTDIDGAGTIEFWTGSAPYALLEPALTMGTDTHTTLEYSASTDFWVVVKSTTANAMDHFSYHITLPVTGAASGTLWSVSWSAADENWILTLKGGQEAAPTIKAYDPFGAEVGTTAQDLSDNNYILNFDWKITMGANYDGIYSFFDPDEGDGEWDDFYIICTANVTAANCGWTIGGAWQICSDGKSYYLNLREAGLLDGLNVRWDEQGKSGTIVGSLQVVSSDIDTSGSGACLFTLTLKECNGNDQAFNQTWETDTLTNFSGSATAETITVQD